MSMCANRGVNLIRCLVSAPTRLQRYKFQTYTTLDKNPFSQPHFLKKPAKRFQMQSYAALWTVWRMRCNFTQVIDGPVVFLFCVSGKNLWFKRLYKLRALICIFCCLDSLGSQFLFIFFKWKDETDSIFFMHFNSFLFLSFGFICWSINLLCKYTSFKG